MKTSEYHIPATGGKKLFAHTYLPDGKSPKAVVIIIHGMLEHSGRYKRFANKLTENEFAVITYDLRAHGKTDPDQLGIIDYDDGFHHMVSDIQFVKNEVLSNFPDLPVIIFAHSMGTFLTQRYMQLYDYEPAGIIYSGSNGKPPSLIYGGLILSKLLSKIKDPEFKSRLIHKMSFEPFNAKFKPNRTDQDWLSRDAEEVDRYISDPYCGFIPSVAFYNQLFSGLMTLTAHKPFAGKNPNIPILIVSGDHDPVSDMGKGIKRLQKQLKDSGANNLTVNLYPGARHELLNEINRDEVMDDVVEWIERILKEALSR